MLYPAKANTITKNVQLSPRVCSQCIIQQTHKKLKMWIRFGVCICVLLGGRKRKEEYLIKTMPCTHYSIMRLLPTEENSSAQSNL